MKDPLFTSFEGLEIGTPMPTVEIVPLAQAIFDKHKAVYDDVNKRWGFPTIMEYVGLVDDERSPWPFNDRAYYTDVHDLDAYNHYGRSGFWHSETHRGPRTAAVDEYISKNGV